MSIDAMPDLVNISGRESMQPGERISLMRAELLQSPFNLVPVADPHSLRSATQEIHDLKLTVGRIRNTIELYDQAIARSTSEEKLAKGAHLILSPTECLILAWRRGGFKEYKRIRQAQRTAI